MHNERKRHGKYFSSYINEITEDQIPNLLFAPKNIYTYTYTICTYTLHMCNYLKISFSVELKCHPYLGFYFALLHFNQLRFICLFPMYLGEKLLQVSF